VVWAKAKLEALGFDRVYTQEVTVPHWDRGELEVRTEAPFPQRLVAASLGGSIGTPQEGLQGEVVRFDSLEALKAAPDAAVAGRIVFLDQSMMRDREGKGYSPIVRGRADGASLAGAKGAAAIVIRSVGTDATARFAHTGAVTYAINAPRIPAVALANPDADQLARQYATAMAHQEPVRLFLRSTARELPMAKSANVIGEIIGSEFPEEVVVVGRRGPLQSAFTTLELRELGELEGVDVIIDPADLADITDADAEAGGKIAKANIKKI
jgi:hypothetical protein